MVFFQSNICMCCCKGFWIASRTLFWWIIEHWDHQSYISTTDEIWIQLNSCSKILNALIQWFFTLARWHEAGSDVIIPCPAQEARISEATLWFLGLHPRGRDDPTRSATGAYQRRHPRVQGPVLLEIWRRSCFQPGRKERSFKGFKTQRCLIETSLKVRPVSFWIAMVSKNALGHVSQILQH